MKKIAKKIWDKSSGWKTIAGLVGHCIWLPVHLFHPKIDIETGFKGHGFIFTLTGVGLGDKAFKFAKSPFGKKAIQIISKLFKQK